jgi:hypothetical protein
MPTNHILVDFPRPWLYFIPPLIVLVTQRLVSSAPVRHATRTGAGLGPANDPRKPAGNAALRLAGLVLGPSVDKVHCRGVDIQAWEWLLFRQERPPAHVERGNGGARAHMGAIDWPKCWGTCRGRGADGGRRVAKNGVHVLEADAASLRVDEIDCLEVSIASPR